MNASLRWRDGLGIGAVLVALALLLAEGGWAWRLDRLLYDATLALWRRPPPPGVLIVAIDDASVDAIGRWPWSRAVHATLLQRLAAARPRAIALDLVLSEPDPDPRQDRLLADAIADAAPVVLPVSLRGGPDGGLWRLRPVPAIAAVATLGAADVPVDADGVLRHAFLRSGAGGEVYPHLALALLQAGGEAPSDDLAVEARPSSGVGADAGMEAPAGVAGVRDGRFLIRYAGPPGTVERVSYVDVLRGALPPDRLAGRYVLIGMTAQGLGDTLATPVNARHQAMPGVEVLANTLYTLRSGDALTPVSERQVGLASAAALLLLLWALARVGPRAALPVAMASVPVALVASALSLRAGIWWSPVAYVLPALLAYPLWSWRRLERAMAGLDAEIGRLAASQEGAVLPAPARSDGLEARLQTLRRAGDLVRQAGQFLADALAALPTATLVADDSGRVLLANARAASLFEVADAGELQGLDLARLLGEFACPVPVDWPVALAGLQAGTDGVAVEARLAPAGDYIVHAAAVALQGQRRLLVSVADIAPAKLAQRQREEVLAFVSHDLRAPASEIVMLADLHLSGRMDTPHDELLQALRRLAERTLAMSEDFVRTSQAETRPLDRREVALPALIDDALQDHRAQARSGGVTLALAPVPAAAVRVDRALVARALGNLVSNAIKHSPVGGTVEVQAWLGRDTATMHLAVRDRGPGLAPEQIAQLARDDTGARVADLRGVGLGLVFVQRVARRHGGRLRARAAPDGPGAVFELVLGLPDAQDAQNTPASGNP